ncbi:bifunctional diguanylate cyclase/phosphodiesterase [Marinimicrobium sp. ABcell2]|uniref:putative bifunctional diguanylate cyclase/phosphodiesterase n=1 Tax=Marinimicrobium sp. ABcell2 TaxID=3069751 RepID=UPI0027ADBFF2|nr:EAL domain-containing protein [Marinimicrobium sp. ABcell2]MDQ2076839.1 EAL domain-containing protein [Marinimicrobium sp. ABcell2]
MHAYNRDRFLAEESSGLQVLLVEDSEGDADLCRHYLEEGFGTRITILHATRVETAETLMRNHTVDVVLLDLGLPDSKGVATVAAIRSFAPDIPIVVLTGNRDAELGIQVIREHAQDFCAKQDLNATLLMHSIRHAIERHRLQTQYSRVLETSPDGVVVLSKDGTVLFANQMACTLLDLDPINSVGLPLPKKLRSSGNSEVTLSGQQVVEVRSVDVDWNSAPAALIVYRDITSRKRAELRLKELVQFDQLTGLASRTYFFDYLARQISSVDRKKYLLAMLFIDLDRFKYVNDTMGHDSGDELLCQVAKRLKSSVREEDFLARLGGDEFALILPSFSSPQEIAHVAEKLIHRFEAPFEVHGAEVTIGLSIGIATYPGSGTGVKALYRAADTAMYRAKEQGTNHFQFYADHMQDSVLNRIRIEQAVRKEVADDRFWFAFQPLVSAGDGATVGMEALIRWPEDSTLCLGPEEFIPVVEHIGLIGQVGRKVLRSAAAMAKVAMELTNVPVRVSVNVSMRQLYENHLGAEVEKVLKEFGLPADCLELELTESSIMGDPERAQRTLEEVRALGVTVAIDDFGTGYSSLSYLRRLPVDVLKIDQSFVQDIGHNQETEAILHSLVGLAHALKLKVVAEGVESQIQRDFLTDAGCDILQGFHICRPGTPAQITNWLRDHPPAL